MFDNNPSEDGSKFGRTSRLTFVGMLVFMIMSTMFIAPAAASPSEQGEIDLCSGETGSSDFITYANNIIALVVYGGLIMGTIAIVVGFAADSSPFISADYSGWKIDGMKYGWGLPIILYAMAFGMDVIGIGISCILPGV